MKRQTTNAFNKLNYNVHFNLRCCFLFLRPPLEVVELAPLLQLLSTPPPPVLLHDDVPCSLQSSFCCFAWLLQFESKSALSELAVPAAAAAFAGFGF